MCYMNMNIYIYIFCKKKINDLIQTEYGYINMSKCTLAIRFHVYKKREVGSRSVCIINAFSPF